MKSYKVRAMVEIEVLVHFNQDPRFEGPFDAARVAMAEIQLELGTDSSGPRLTGQVGSLTVISIDLEGDDHG
jgi:hypothetical protein